MVSKIICPNCGSEAYRVIAAAMPMKFCNQCHTLWGFWSSLYIYLVIPIESIFNSEFAFMAYKNSYWKAILYWLFIGRKKND